jgi:two-component system sensor histidine kinase BaeS
MIDYFRRHFGAKIFLSYLAVIVIGLLVLAAAGQAALPLSFRRHMLGMMTGAPGAGTGMGMGPGYGRQAQAATDPNSQLFVDYRASFNDALLIAGGAALLSAVILSVFFSRTVTKPVQAVSAATHRIAAGRYDERLPVQGADELAQLAAGFNQMAQKLDEVESMRRRLIADVSHELRTPLTAIQGSMEGLMDGVLPANDETYGQIHTEAQRLNRLVDDLQELSRVEARAFELHLEPVDVSGLARTVLKRLGPLAASRGVSLATQVHPHLPSVRGDQDRLVQVLTNLVSNALQYTPQGGSVTVAAKRNDGEVQLSVRDTGGGIPAEHLAHIFDRFYRVDKSRSRQAGGGSGIGLTIARALVEAQGGRIWVESEGAGKGSVFTFTIPLTS